MAPIKEQCKICKLEVFMLLNHVKNEHNVERKDYIIKYFYDGTHPTCKCGCGELLTMRIKKPYFLFEYVTGHNSKGTNNPMYGKHFSQEVKEKMKISAKRRMEKQIETTGFLPYHSSEAIEKRAKKQTDTYINTLEKICNITVINKDRKNGIGYYTIVCNVCNNKFEKFHTTTILCPKCNPPVKSQMENEIYNCLINMIPNTMVKKNHRSILNDYKELDFYIPDQNLAIEFDGLYYHGEINGGKNRFYHLNKTKECNEKQIELIHIFEDEWINYKNIVLSKLSQKLNVFSGQKIHARKCTIKEISFTDCKEFLNRNHLQGSDMASIRLGLYYENELVSVMTFAKPNASKGSKVVTNNKTYELSRYCVKCDVLCIGGASKLFKYFIDTYTPDIIHTFADRRWSTKDAFYTQLGFKLVSETAPNYWYFKSNSKRHHRFNFTKNKTIKMGGDPNLTEWANMKLFGYDRIWDCGNFKYTWIS